MIILNAYNMIIIYYNFKLYYKQIKNNKEKYSLSLKKDYFVKNPLEKPLLEKNL
jgi:hypothetical protein